MFVKEVELTTRSSNNSFARVAEDQPIFDQLSCQLWTKSILSLKFRGEDDNIFRQPMHTVLADGHDETLCVIVKVRLQESQESLLKPSQLL